jgi:NAD-dependent deacetylase
VPRPEGVPPAHPAGAPRRIDKNAVVHARYAEVTGWLGEARHLVVLTGAGISTESGIPDFRGPQGVWTKNPAAEKTATLQYYVNDREVRRQAWRNRVEGGGYWTAEPNAAHRALVELERKAALDLLVTQNVDGLHHAAGNSPEKVIEIHGNVREVKCLSCSWRAPMQVALDRVRAGEQDPDCPECGGILKSATISFGENLVPDDLARAHAAASRADLFLAIGTSLAVYPAAGLPEYALANGARLVVMNAEPTPFDDAAAVVVREQLGTVLPAVVKAVPDPTRLGISDP